MNANSMLKVQRKAAKAADEKSRRESAAERKVRQIWRARQEEIAGVIDSGDVLSAIRMIAKHGASCPVFRAAEALGDIPYEQVRVAARAYERKAVAARKATKTAPFGVILEVRR